MTKSELNARILEAVEEYLEKTEAWEDAQVVIDPASEKVELMEIEETDDLPDDFTVCAVMDLIEMSANGDWKADKDSVDALAEEIMG